MGIEEGWAIAHYVREAMEEDRNGDPRAIVAIVDVPSQAYGYREELLGIHQALAAAVDAYASARLAGHPAIRSARFGSRDLSNRLSSEEARNGGRIASIQVRKKLVEQWT
jgi:hypothetical protein